MFSNKEQQQQQQQQKQSGGFKYGNTPTPSKSPNSKSPHSKSRSSTKRRMHNTQNPFQNQAELQRVMALFQ
jgi:hypothetical protein